MYFFIVALMPFTSQQLVTYTLKTMEVYRNGMQQHLKTEPTLNR